MITELLVNQTFTPPLGMRGNLRNEFFEMTYDNKYNYVLIDKQKKVYEK